MKSLLITIGLSIICLCDNHLQAQDITVATASNAQYAINELVDLFEKESDIVINHVIGSSGRITSQIINGAPFDIFISADSEYPQYLYENKYANRRPEIYAKGSLVLWTLKDIDITMKLNSLNSEFIKRIAIASPKSAPYGRLAVEAIKSVNLFNSIQEKLVFGSSISQVNQYVTLKTVDVGLTAKSIVSAPKLKGKGKWVEIDGFYLDQSLILINEENQNALKFYTFMLSQKAKAIFRKHGYIVGDIDEY